MFYQVQFVANVTRMCCVGGCGRPVVNNNDHACVLCSAHKCRTPGCNRNCVPNGSYCGVCRTYARQQQTSIVIPIAYPMHGVSYAIPIAHVPTQMYVPVQVTTVCSGTSGNGVFNPNTQRRCAKCQHLFTTRIRDEIYCVNCTPVGYSYF